MVLRPLTSFYSQAGPWGVLLPSPPRPPPRPGAPTGPSVGLAKLAAVLGDTGRLNQLMKIPEVKNQFPGMVSLENWVISSCCSSFNFEVKLTHEVFVQRPWVSGGGLCGTHQGISQKSFPLKISLPLPTLQCFSVFPESETSGEPQDYALLHAARPLQDYLPVGEGLAELFVFVSFFFLFFLSRFLFLKQ